MKERFRFGQPVTVMRGAAATAVQCRYWFTLRSGEKMAIVMWTRRNEWQWALVNADYVALEPTKVSYPMPDELRQKNWGLSWVDKWQEDYRAEKRKRT